MSYPFDLSCIDVLDFLENLDQENLRREGMREVRFSCPYPGHEHGDASASAYMNLETTAWYCHGCKRRGNAITFAASMLNISPIKAKRLLREAYAPHTLNPDDRNIKEELIAFLARRRAREEQPTNTTFGEEMIERFAVDWRAVEQGMMDGKDYVPEDFVYMILRGFDGSTLDYWDFGWDERTKRITFAVRDEWGKLVGVKGRATDGRHPKYLVIGDDGGSHHYGFGRYFTGNVVFGLHEAIDGFEVLDHGEPAELIVCEGELNAIALWQLGFRCAVALNGSNLTTPQMRLIRSYADKVTFFFDSDTAGNEALWGRDDEETGEHKPGALEILNRDLDVKLVLPHEGDPAQMLEDHEESRPGQLLDEAQSYTLARLLAVRSVVK